MRKMVLSLVAVTALSGYVYGGGDIAPVEPVVEEAVVTDASAFYVGIGYGYFNQKNDGFNINGLTSVEFESNSLMLQAGYQYNRYVSFEGRYWGGSADIYQRGGTGAGDFSGDLDAWGLWVKPTYPVTEAFDIYAMLGYASSSIEYDASNTYWDTDGFSWGLGIQYEIMENVMLFADYLNLGMPDTLDVQGTDISADIDTYTFNIGLSYKF